MAQQTFSRKSDAIAAGYAPARGTYGRYRGFKIHSVDVSGPRSFGYNYELRIGCGQTDWTYPDGHFANDVWVSTTPWDSDAAAMQMIPLGLSGTITLSDDLNKIGQQGCFTIMFAPDVIAVALERAHLLIDEFFEKNPAARERESQIKAADAESAARHLEKSRRRAERLAEKYGRENLHQRHAALLQS